MVLGEVASSGLARGTAILCACANRITVARRVISPNEVEAEIVKLDAALAIVEDQLIDLQKKVQQSLGDQSAGIFEAHIALLRAPSLRKEIRAGCLDRHINVEAAVEESIEKLVSTFAQVEEPYLRERAADLEDLGRRLLDVLTRDQPSENPVFPQGSVLVTSELLPSVTARLDRETIRGVVVERGGQTAHATILARELGVPLLIRVPDAMKRIRTGDRLVVDGLAGRVFINPTAHILREYDRLESDLHAHRTALQTMVELPPVTSDGTRIRLSANIGKTADAPAAAAAANADGIGLYRTEFVFLVQDHLPSEEEQYRIYRATAEYSKPRHVVIRLLDIGGDKPLHYFPLSAEANPSLGLRGTRLLLAHAEILRTQTRAILRLNATHPVSILLPMVGDVEDVRAVKTIIESVKAQLAAEHQTFDPRIPIGAMIETPSAAVMIGRLAREVDFLSIGTNDLVQYLLTTDRTSSTLAPYYEPVHPAVLHVLASLASTAGEKNKDISICGEMAGNPAYTRL
ncbi:MAG: phosphoenolpyruvate--protein phosphotransferase, partial [Planctomycetota bacterium]|nr:phosphoenolpyruvate--protein phosphotransferase [Planctomycetota bacterium]